MQKLFHRQQHRHHAPRRAISSLILIYGKSGSGKSLFAKRIQTNAVRQGISNFLWENPSKNSSNEQLRIIADAMTRLASDQVELGIVTVGSTDPQLRIVIESRDQTPFEVLDLLCPKV